MSAVGLVSTDGCPLDKWSKGRGQARVLPYITSKPRTSHSRPRGSYASEPRASTWPGAQPQISTPSVPCRISPKGQTSPSGNKKPGLLQS